MKLLRILGILFLLLTAGCGPAAPEQGGYTVEDVRGKTVRLARPPQKILTDSLHLDETIWPGFITWTGNRGFPSLRKKPVTWNRCSGR